MPGVLQHVAVPVPPGLVADCVGFYRILGFEPVPVPATLEGRSAWVAAGGQHVHLLMTDEEPGPGHLALHVADYAATLAALAEAGHPAEPRREHWGAPRAFASDPAGNRVELMASPPPPA